MRSEEIIESLALVAAIGIAEDLSSDEIVRAVLSRLAEIGNSPEMDMAAACAVRTLEPAEYDAAFRAALRNLSGGE